MDAKLTPEQAIKWLRGTWPETVQTGIGTEGVKALRQVADLLESLAADAAIGRVAVEILDSLPHCQGEFDSPPCLYVREISSNNGCHLERMCRLRAGEWSAGIYDYCRY